MSNDADAMLKLSRKEFLRLFGALPLAGTGLLAHGAADARSRANVKDGSQSLVPRGQRKTRVIFRYFLPWAPAWGEQKLADQRLDELVRFGHEAGIDSIQFFVNTFRHSYYVLPVDVESQKAWIDWMVEVVAPRIRAEGFGFELNLQQMLGATNSGTDLRSLYKWKQFMVDHYGNTSQGTPCPEDPVYREEMAKMLRGWAATRASRRSFLAFPAK